MIDEDYNGRNRLHHLIFSGNRRKLTALVTLQLAQGRRWACFIRIEYCGQVLCTAVCMYIECQVTLTG